MKNKKFKTAFTLISLVILFAFILQIYGCGDTKGKNLPTSPSGNTLTLSASPSSVAANNTDLSTITAKITGRASGTVNFTTNMGTLSVSSVNVNSSGEAKVTIKSSIVGTATITATAGNLSRSVGVTFSATNSLFITSIVTGGTSGGTPAEVDIHIISDCDGDPDTIDPEEFYDDEATVTISNMGTSLVNITDYTIVYTGKDAPANVTIPSYVADISAQISAKGGTATLPVNLIKAGSSGQSGTKLWYAATYGITNTYTFDALYTFTGTDLGGNSVSVSGSVEIKLGAYNYCK